RRRGRAARGTTHEICRDEQWVARAEALERLTDEGYAVAVAGGRVDHRTAELAHALELGVDVIAHRIAEWGGADSNGRNPLAARGYGPGDQRPRRLRRLGGRQPAREQGSDACDHASFQEIAARDAAIRRFSHVTALRGALVVAGRVLNNSPRSR